MSKSLTCIAAGIAALALLAPEAAARGRPAAGGGYRRPPMPKRAWAATAPRLKTSKAAHGSGRLRGWGGARTGKTAVSRVKSKVPTKAAKGTGPAKVRGHFKAGHRFTTGHRFKTAPRFKGWGGGQTGKGTGPKPTPITPPAPRRGPPPAPPRGEGLPPPPRSEGAPPPPPRGEAPPPLPRREGSYSLRKRNDY
jgi:hypothetical protein